MKFKYIILNAIVIIATFSSCDGDDLVKVNENPNVATSIEPDFLFGYAAYSWSGVRTGGDLFLPIAFANQSLSTGGNAGWGYGEDRYDISPFSIGNTWRGYFVSVGNNLNFAIRESESSTPVNNNAAAQSKLVLANSVFENTMIYGDIPYRQAWKTDEFPNPVFDPQEQILNDLLSLIDEAINQIDESSILKISKNDPFYQGDMAKWKKYGNSLKLKILMVMVDKVPAKASQIGALVTATNGISSASDNLEIGGFSNATNSENPKNKLFKRYAGGENPWIFANSNVFDFMDQRSDPRIGVYYDKNESGNYVAVPTATDVQLDANSKPVGSAISLSNLWKVDSNDLILSYQEILLLKAEAYARGLGVAVDLGMANTLYKEGVKQSLLYYSVPAADADNYVNNTLTDISALSQTDAIFEIHVQQWIDFQDRSLEGWIQSRRSGPEGSEVPNLSIPNGAPAGGLFRRYTYPSGELTTNSSAPDGSDKIFEKLWFDL